MTDIAQIMSSDTSDTSDTGNVCLWASHFQPLTADNLSGWVSSCSAAEEVRRLYEASKSIHFIGCKKGTFGKNDHGGPTPSNLNLTSHLVRFVDHSDGIVPFDGVPFMVLSTYTLGCVYGRDKHLRAKNEEEMKRALELKGDHPRAKKRRKRIQRSKKQNCSATMKMKEVLRFPQFKTVVQKKWDCAEQSRKLRRAILDGREIELERRVYISFPPDQAHNTHHIGELAGFLNPLHGDVKLKIRELVAKGVRNVEEMKRHLKIHVETVLFPDPQTRPSPNNTGLYPPDNIIRKHIYSTLMKLRVMTTKPLHHCTPLLESVPMSKVAGRKVFIKCENLQPSSSFKIRGIGNRIQKAVKSGGNHIICSSGGNAGFAAAYAARQMGLPATIVIPESTPEFVADGLRDEGANVLVRGKVWDHANDYALQLAGEMDGSIVIHPFDHPDTWEGHSTVITECASQMPSKPDVVLVCVGGGGLLCGVVQGMQKAGWRDVPIVAMETRGADSYNAAVKAGELVTLPDITSQAKCLGSLTVCQRSLDYYKEHPILSVVIDDREAVTSCLQFLDDHRMLVELACGAALAGVYGNTLGELQAQGKLSSSIQSVLVVVCGGKSITLQRLLEYKESFGV